MDVFTVRSKSYELGDTEEFPSISGAFDNL